MHLFLGLVLTFMLFLLLRQWGTATEEQRRKGLFYGLVTVLAVVCLLLVVTGRMHFLMAIAVALLPMIRRIRMVRRLWSWWRGAAPGAGGDSAGGQGQQRKPSSGRMTVAEARELLKVSADATREEIVQAHRRLMQQVHPDRGGDNELAARVNEAKEVLLGR